MKRQDEHGAVDLTAVMVGVTVTAVVGAAAAAYAFGYVPLSQDGKAKDQLVAIETAQSASWAKSRTYLSGDELVADGLIDTSYATRVALGPGGVCYVAVVMSDSDSMFFIEGGDDDASSLTADSRPGCVPTAQLIEAVTAIGGDPTGLQSDPAAVVAAAPVMNTPYVSGSLVKFTWSTVQGATGYVLEWTTGDGWVREPVTTTAKTVTVIDSDVSARVVAVTAAGETASSAVVTVHAGRYDIVANGSFSDGFAGWVTSGDAAVSDRTADTVDGVAGIVAALPADAWAAQPVPVTAGSELVLSFDVKATVPASVKVIFRSGSGQVVSEKRVDVSGSGDTAATWSTVSSAVGPVPSGAVTAEVRLDGSGGWVSGTYARFDNVQVLSPVPGAM